MRIAYYPDTDSMYIDLSEKPSADSKEISPGVVLDYDADGNIAGIDIDNANGKSENGGLLPSPEAWHSTGAATNLEKSARH